MHSVHPVFDTKTRTWFTTEPGLKAEAVSLGELQAKLGAGVRIEGYYPLGKKIDIRRPLPLPCPAPSGTTFHVKHPAPPATAAPIAPPAESLAQPPRSGERAPWGSLRDLTPDQKAERRKAYARNHYLVKKRQRATQWMGL